MNTLLVPSRRTSQSDSTHLCIAMKNRILFGTLFVFAALAGWLAMVDRHALYMATVISIPFAWVALLWFNKR
jgi:hypothetical protein